MTEKNLNDFSIDDYKKAKLAGTVSVTKTGEGYNIQYAQFDPMTGDAAEPLTIPITADFFDTQLSDLQDELAGFDVQKSATQREVTDIATAKQEVETLSAQTPKS